MRKFLMDAVNILAGALAGFTSYLLLGFTKGFHTLEPQVMLLAMLMGFFGGVFPTLWEIFSSSRDLARISHSWLTVGILLIAIHLGENSMLDAACFGYLFHLFVDSSKRKLAPPIQLKSCNRRLAYGIIILVYAVLIAYALYARQHPPVS